MKRKIIGAGLVVAVFAVIAAAAAYAINGGELPANRTSGHIVVGSPGNEVQGGDPGTPSISVESWSWGVTNAATDGGGGGGGTGRASLSELKITKTVDRASPVLAFKCASGQHIPEVVLTVDRPVGSNRPYLEIKLTDVIVTSVKPGGSGDAIPIEEVTFTYDRVRLTYTTRDDQVVQTTIVNT